MVWIPEEGPESVSSGVDLPCHPQAATQHGVIYLGVKQPMHSSFSMLGLLHLLRLGGNNERFFLSKVFIPAQQQVG